MEQSTVAARKTIKNTIIRYIADEGPVSRNDIIRDCGFSLPTVLQKIKELAECGLIEESGQSESNGGRKARLLSVVKDARYAAGVNITAHHLEMVLVGLDGTVLTSKRVRLLFELTHSYYRRFGAEIRQFINENVCDAEKILGVGISVPGILDSANKILLKSHALQLENFSLRELEATVGYPVLFENDANAAAFSEKGFRNGTAFYLSLNYTVGGSFSVNGKVFGGQNNKSSEIGHTTLVPGGKQCYCGKKGCVDSYCSAKVLAEDNLEEFFRSVKAGDTECRKRWDKYLENLAVVICNLRILYDCEIIVGGHVGGYLEPDLQKLRLLAMEQNPFDVDASFIKCGRYRWEASAYGMALHLIAQFFS